MRSCATDIGPGCSAYAHVGPRVRAHQCCSKRCRISTFNRCKRGDDCLYVAGSKSAYISAICCRQCRRYLGRMNGGKGCTVCTIYAASVAVTEIWCTAANAAASAAIHCGQCCSYRRCRCCRRKCRDVRAIYRCKCARNCWRNIGCRKRRNISAVYSGKCSVTVVVPPALTVSLTKPSAGTSACVVAVSFRKPPPGIRRSSAMIKQWRF